MKQGKPFHPYNIILVAQSGKKVGRNISTCESYDLGFSSIFLLEGSPCLLFSSNYSLTIVLFVSMLSLLELLPLFHDTKFFHFIFLFVSLLLSFSFFQFRKLQMWPSTNWSIQKVQNLTMLCGVQKLHKQTTIYNIRRLQNQTMLLWVFCAHFFSFNFLVVNPSKHNNQCVFHLDFTSTLKIGPCSFPSFLWDKVMYEFPTSQCFSSFAIFLFISILIFAHLIERNQVNTTSFESSFNEHNDMLFIIWFFILISSIHYLHLKPLVTHPIE